MVRHSTRYDFTSSEQQIIDQRIAEAVPEFSSGDYIARLVGKPFSA